ncbi:YkvI family membrane protein [Virgibacillus oceani]|uniref:Membrane protein n=1 Tax=Virgibacillus oceani TaxID=1479511 RepID=A0A917HRC5_9BACI|nr:hypothetical protein [Virgibacillus oceani]GGG86929.1 membrane protein [Virgibacillus oceani]
MNQRISILILAATYVGTVVGAGFSSGKEIVTFFSLNGSLGTLGIAISGILFIIAGTKIMVISARIQAYSFREFNDYLFGIKIGKIVNIFVFIVIICVTSVLLSGAGAVFHEQLGLPYQTGIIVTLILCYIVILKGLKGIFAINSYTVPIMIIFSLFVVFAIFGQNPHKLMEQVIPGHVSEDLSWAVSPFTYSAFNIITAQVVLVPLGNEIRDERILRWGGFWGGLILFFLLLINHFSLSAFPETFTHEIPIAGIIKRFGIFIHVLFLFVIYGEIFNSVVGNVFGITRQLKSTFGLRYQQTVLIILLVIFLVSQVGYGKLVTVLYPLLGYISLFALVHLLFKKMP